MTDKHLRTSRDGARGAVGSYLTQIESTKMDVTELMVRVEGYVSAAQYVTDKHFAENYKNLDPPELTIVTSGTRYVKVFKTEKNDKERGRNGCIFAFIDRTNGDILKPATYKAPAKHARGNVFDADYGISRTGAYGPNYLK